MASTFWSTRFQDAVITVYALAKIIHSLCGDASESFWQAYIMCKILKEWDDLKLVSCELFMDWWFELVRKFTGIRFLLNQVLSDHLLEPLMHIVFSYLHDSEDVIHLLQHEYLNIKDQNEMGDLHNSPGQKLYYEAKCLFNASDEKLNDKLFHAKRLFEIYRDMVKVEKPPVVRQPIDDRHLYYLSCIENVETQRSSRFAVSPLFGEWRAWVNRYGTKSPRQALKAELQQDCNQVEAWYKATINLETRKGVRTLAEALLTFPNVLILIVWSYTEECMNLQHGRQKNYWQKEMHLWSTSEVIDWLSTFLPASALDEYGPNFAENAIDGPTFVNLTEEEMIQELKLNGPHMRKRVLRARENFFPSKAPEASIPRIFSYPSIQEEENRLSGLVTEINTLLEEIETACDAEDDNLKLAKWHDLGVDKLIYNQWKTQISKWQIKLCKLQTHPSFLYE